MKIHYRPAYNTTSVAYDTTRKAKAMAAVIRARQIDGVELVSPKLATIEELLAVHLREYLKALRDGSPESLASSNGIGWDEYLLAAVRASTGGVRDAVLEAFLNRVHSGSLSSGLHHARADRGAGYCTLNGLVVGAFAAKGAGAKRVLIVDFDAHCGGGTASLIEGHDGIEQIDVSVSPYDQYPSRPTARLVVSDGRDYLGDIERLLATVESPRTVAVVIDNAGMDPHHAAGGVGPIDAEVLRAREAMVFEWADSHGLPVAWVLAGGYTLGIEMPELVDLHMLTLEAALAASTTAA